MALLLATILTAMTMGVGVYLLFARDIKFTRPALIGACTLTTSLTAQWLLLGEWRDTPSDTLTSHCLVYVLLAIGGYGLGRSIDLTLGSTQIGLTPRRQESNS